jgi:predicted nucleic acid-binding protein
LSCVLDSDVVIAALDDHDAHHRAAVRGIRVLSRDGLLLSLVNYAEVLVQPAEDEESMRAALAAIALLGIELVTPTAAIARDAARMRSSGVSLPDAFAMATARARSATIATFDRQVRRALPRAGLQLAPSVR